MSQLLESFENEYPDVIENALQYQYATSCAFNRRGTLLATGLTDGRCCIWDFEARVISKVLETTLVKPEAGADSQKSDSVSDIESFLPSLISNSVDVVSKQVTSLCWSRNGRKLLVGADDGRLTIWDVESSNQDFSYQFDSPITFCQFNPKNASQVVVCTAGQQPQLFTLSSSPNVKLSALSSLSSSCSSSASASSSFSKKESTKQEMDVDDPANSVPASASTSELSPFPSSISFPTVDSRGNVQETTYLGRPLLFTEGVFAPTARAEVNTIAVFNKRATSLLTGSSRGTVKLLDTQTFEVREQLKISGAAAIKYILFSFDGSRFIVQSNDKCVRLFNSQSLAQLHQFQDVVNRTAWRRCCFSSNGEYIMAAVASKDAHNIYIWNVESGLLTKILEGEKESIVDLVSHPTRPIVLTCGVSGAVYVWAKTYTENWSAFAPDFEPLEENLEYVEREDEFDLVPDEQPSNLANQALLDVEVDIMTPMRNSAFSDCEDELMYLPTVPLPDDTQHK